MPVFKLSNKPRLDYQSVMICSDDGVEIEISSLDPFFTDEIWPLVARVLNNINDEAWWEAKKRARKTSDDYYKADDATWD